MFREAKNCIYVDGLIGKNMIDFDVQNRSLGSKKEERELWLEWLTHRYELI